MDPQNEKLIPWCTIERHHHIFEDRQRRKDIGDLKGAQHSPCHAPVRRQSADIPAFKENFAGTRTIAAGNNVVKGGFAGAVGSDQRAQPPPGDLQRYVVQGLEFSEIPGDVLHFKNDCIAHARVHVFSRREKISRTLPSTPLGKSSTRMTRIAPRKIIQLVVYTVM